MIGFLILHYKNAEETIACVDSIRALTFTDGAYRILIADNASNNGSYERLAALYESCADITVLAIGANLGFSAGNNAGWAAFPGRESVDFLVVCNSDVIFDQLDFPEKLYCSWRHAPFDVLGPDIRRPGKGRAVRTSPLAPIRLRESSVRRSLAIHRARLAAAQGPTPAGRLAGRLHYPGLGLFLWHCWYSLCIRLFSLKNQLYSPPAQGVLLQGACLIFSRQYLSRYEKLFEPEPFFYYEELLLWAKGRRDGLTLRYDPALQVLHLEGVATRAEQRDEARRFLFVQENLLRSEELVLQQTAGLLK